MRYFRFLFFPGDLESWYTALMSELPSEGQYRSWIQKSFDRIETCLENVDPDVIECEQQFGALTLKLPSGARTILSAQPSVRQLWLAMASKGVAYHFNYDGSKEQWWDDKGLGIELFACLGSFLKEATGQDFEL